MLRIMRKNASSLVIKVIFVVIVIVFVFWGVGSFQESKADRVALVNGEPISVQSYQQEYENALENLRQQYGNNLNRDMIKMFKIPKQIIDTMVRRQLLFQEADKLNIRVTDTELADAIQSMSAFQEVGVFNNRRYTALLDRSRLTVKEFEASQRQSMVIDKLNALITSGIKVTDGEILDWYKWINASVDIDYVLFDPYGLTDITPTEDAMSAFYEVNKENYKTEQKVKVQYLEFRLGNYMSEDQVKDTDIREYYETHMSEFQTEKTVEARHILLTVDEDASPEIVAEKRTKAEEILVMAREGKDFAELAKEYSEGATRETGGLLGEFKKSDMVAPFSEAAFSMAEGEISTPVRTQFGFHLIKVEKIHEASVVSLEDATDGIRKGLAKEAAGSLAYDMAEDAFDKALSDEDFEKTAAELNVPLHSTEYFTSKGPAAGVADPVTFASAAFELNDEEISDVLNIGDSYFILRKTGAMPSVIPELAAVETQVRIDLLRKMRDEAAVKKAEEFLLAAKDAGDMEKASKEYGIEMLSSGFFKRSDSIPEIGRESEMIQAAFLLSKDNKIGDTVFKGAKGYYVIQFKEKKSPDIAEFDSQKDTIKTQLLSQKQQILFENWLSKVWSESEIQIEESYLN